MRDSGFGVAPRIKLSIIIPCFNEEETLGTCLERVLALHSPDIELELIVVDDCSEDKSLAIAQHFSERHPKIRVLHHAQNLGKGAALRTGFRAASGDIVAVQDADLEYNPQDLLTLIEPLRDKRADVVFGSRFKGQGPHRVLYFWHYVGNAILTLLSNMCTDLNLTDMESGYKVFRREVLQSLDLREDRFGFEPEIVAKVARRDLRIYEMAISYDGRTYAEGKKITWKDGVRALYCIFRYNADRLPLPMQFLIYTLIGGTAALVNLVGFIALLAVGLSLTASAILAYGLGAAANYLLCIALLFRHRARWNSAIEVVMYFLVVVTVGGIDVGITRTLATMGRTPWLAKSVASLMGLIFNFLGRRFVVF